MTSHRYENLIHWIASQVDSVREIDSILEALIDYREWEMALREVYEERKKREKRRVKRANKRAIDKGLTGTLTVEQWVKTLEDFQGRCAYCKRPFSIYDLEHFVPLAQGVLGSSADNCVPSCKSCNRLKNVKHVKIWITQQSYFHDLPDLQDPIQRSVIDVYRYLRKKATHITEEYWTKWDTELEKLLGAQGVGFN